MLGGLRGQAFLQLAPTMTSVIWARRLGAQFERVRVEDFGQH